MLFSAKLVSFQAGLNMVTKVQSLALKDDNILVMSVCPGWVQTDMGTSRATLTPYQVKISLNS